ncbi:MAG TPA: TonB-dependent receptor [Longimicrobiales bacterium]
MTPRTRIARIPAAAALALGLATGPGLHAQTHGSLSGRIIDAGTGRPVADVTVSLEPLTPGLLPDSRTALTAVRTVVTGESGLYRFLTVGVGSYRLRIERIGYRAALLEIEVLRPASGGVSVALELDPVALEPVHVEQRSAPPFQRAVNARDELDAARLSAERQRQADFLSTDTRVMTYADVMDGVTLGEGDVFRALQRFPGVGTRDDYTAELWTRGAPWTQTRVTFDGVPLFNPVHAVGVLSAITPEILGSVHFHPGVRPPALGEGAAGAVDLRTRPGDGNGELRGVGDLSAASAKLVLSQRPAERAAWLVAVRRSHLGVLTSGLDRLGLDTLDLPYVFHDVAARFDVAAAGVQLEASGLWEEDRLEGDVSGVLEQTRARWGNRAGRMTLRTRLGKHDLAQSFGASRFDARTEERVVRTRDAVPSWTEPESRNTIHHVEAAGQLIGTGPGSRWSGGYDVSAQRIDYDGPFPRYYAVKPDTTMQLQYARSLVIGALWANRRSSFGRAQLDTGLRIEASDAVANGGAIQASPRIALRLALSDDHSVSISAGRTWQHMQSIALAGPSIHPAFHATHFWLAADERAPAIRADILNAGTERWLGHGWLASMNAFIRAAAGLTLPDPAPGRLGRRPLFVRGAGSAHGIETTVRRIGASWSVSAGHTWGRSEVEIDGLRYPSSADRRHVVDLMAGARVWRGLRAAAAFTAMTGAPFTRAYSRSQQDCTDFGFGCEDPTGSYIDVYNAQRTPGYRSLDVSVQWMQRLGRLEAGAYVQVRNVLGRDNASTYAGSGPIARVQRPDGTHRFIWEDRFEQGLPRMPMIGLRATF